MRFRLGCLASLTTLAACGSVDGESGAADARTCVHCSEGGTSGGDAGGRRDAGERRDASSSPEAGHRADGEAHADAEQSRDAGHDAEAGRDAADGSPDVVTIAPTQCSPSSITLDDSNVYWLNGCGSNNDYGAVMTAPKTGGAAVTLAPAQPSPWNIAVSADAVYWGCLSLGQVTSVPLTGIADGGWVSYLYPADGGTGPELTGIAADAQHIFWSDAVGVGMSALDGSGATALPGAGVMSPWDVVLDCPVPAGSCTAAHVYVTGGDGTPDGLYSIALDGGAVSTLASNVSPPPSGITWSSAGLFWTGWTDTTNPTYVVMSTASPTPIATGTGITLGIAADATNVYWTTYAVASPGGEVLEVPVGGGAVTTIASGQNEPANIVIDDTSVYWTNSGPQETTPLGMQIPTGSVMKAPK